MNTTTAKKPRLLYIDNLRILLTILVIMHHFAIGYGGPGTFYYTEDGPMSDISEILMTLLLAINQAFFMGFFFMISSYFSPGSIDRKGTGRFLKDRLKRLGIPLLFYMLVIAPLLSYGSARLQGYDVPLGQHLAYQYSAIANFNASQMWFIAALLIFAIVYGIWRRFAKPMPDSEEAAPRNTIIIIFALALGMVTFTVRIWLSVGFEIPILNWQIPHFPQYIAMYVLGIVAYRRGWFASITDSQGKTWLYTALGLILLFPVLFIAGGALEGVLDPYFGGLHWQSFVYSVWEQFMCMAMVITLLVWFRKRFTEQGRLAKSMSDAAYATYVFHAPIIFLLALALRGIRLDMGLKYLLVVPFAVAAAFLVGYIAKQLPVVRNIL
jgi:hypothetical protein